MEAPSSPYLATSRAMKATRQDERKLGVSILCSPAPHPVNQLQT